MQKVWSWPKRATRLVILFISLLAAVSIATILVAGHWPYSEPAIRSRLSAELSAEVYFGHFGKQYWPPGCVAESVVIRRPNSPYPVATVQRLSISSNLWALLHHRASLVHAQGLHVTLEHSDLNSRPSSNQENTIEEFEAEDSVLEISGKTAEHPLEFAFRRFSISRTGPSNISFAAEFQNPLPKGMIRTEGKFGPWNRQHPEQTSISGSYSLEDADLGVFDSIAGLTSAHGSFQGSLERLEVEGATHTALFTVKQTEHGLPLETHFHASVDATKGNVALEQVRASFGRDEIDAHGSIAREGDNPRTASLDFECRNGRVEDTFYPFIHSRASPLTGALAFEMHVVLPGGSESFLKRITIESDFRLQNARFTSSDTESRLRKIGEQPQAGNLLPLFSNFEGRVQVTRGVAHFSDLSVEDGGASARFRGNYNLINQRVDMHGKLRTQATLANTTHGIKAAFAKVLEPLFKKKPHLNVVPVRISGTYSHPSFGLDL